MKFTQSQIDEMSVTELCDTIELIDAEKNERLQKAEEVRPKLVEFVSANVEIIEEETTVEGNIIRTDAID
jgi:hypothetical protein